MQISKETIDTLKNFAAINSNLLLKTGSKISTISQQKNIMASSTITESFPSDFGIYDLNQFLGALSLFEDPDLNFKEKYVTIAQAGNSIKYYAAEAANLHVPTKEITFPEAEINFVLTAGASALIHQTSGVLRAPDLTIVGENGKVSIVVCDKKDASHNTYNVDVGTTDATFKVNLKVENLKMLPGEYNVSISSKKISRFQGTGNDLTYYIAVEADSAFTA